MNNITIYRRFRDEETWEKVTESDCIEHTEGSGYWKENTVMEMLKSGQEVFTPHAIYSINGGNL